MWEEIRQKKISDEKRSQNIEELLDLMRGKTFEVPSLPPLLYLLLSFSLCFPFVF